MSKGKPASVRRGEASAPRTLAADPVFESLAGAILRGKFAANSPLPPERDLAALFNVSRLIVRQALHRLKDIGLVRVRQGGQTIALDPDSATDPRIIALTMELAPEKAHEQDVLERQVLGGAMLLELAEMRITAAQIDALEASFLEFVGKGEGVDVGSFETHFWISLAEATDNKVLIREARWWFSLMGKQPERRRKMYGRPELRMALYRGLLDALRARAGAARFYTQAIKPLLSREM